MTKSTKQRARHVLAEKINLSREELIRRMDDIRGRSQPSSGQAIIDEIRHDRDNNLGRNYPELDE